MTQHAEATEHHVEPVRHDVTFTSGATTCAAWHYEPAATSGPVPVVVMAHGFTGTRRDRLGAFADRFASAGYAALVFDYRGFGDSDGTPDEISLPGQAEDWRNAIACARSLPGVDPDRVVTFGSSMGGGHALAAALDDSRIAGVISQVPLLDVRQLTANPLRVRARMLLAAVRGRYLPAVGQPGDVAFINAPDAERGWRHVVAIGDDSRWRDRASARWMLGRPYWPGRRAKALHCPWLVCVAQGDRVARPMLAIKAALSAPRGELRTYPGVDHFDVYDGPEHEAVVADELEFLRRHVGSTAAAS